MQPCAGHSESEHPKSHTHVHSHACAGPSNEAERPSPSLSSQNVAESPAEIDLPAIKSDNAAVGMGNVTWLKSLLDGSAALPHSAAFSLPAIVSCPGGCSEDSYCSTVCAEAAWESYHQLLCIGAPPLEVSNGDLSSEEQRSASRGDHGTGKRSRIDAGASVSASASASGTVSAAQSAAPSAVQSVADLGLTCTNPAANGIAGGDNSLLVRNLERSAARRLFSAHADATNDIFHVAARVVAGVLLRAQAELLTQHQHRSAVSDLVSEGEDGGADERHLDCWKALQAAWTPHACAWKAVWWEAVALPGDVTDEGAFRAGSIIILSPIARASCRHIF